jgi:sRNA-binding carbon storage regulator CsrA
MRKIYLNAKVGDTLQIDGHTITIIANPKRHVRLMFETEAHVGIVKKEVTDDSRAHKCHSLTNTEV